MRKKGDDVIDPSRFVSQAIVAGEVIPFAPKNSFKDFHLAPALQRNVEARGYKTPTAIQDDAIPHLLSGKDVIGIANTGTGKTAAFVLPILHRLLTERQGERRQSGQTLVLAPTRELALQIQTEFDAFAKGLGFQSVLCVGGINISPQKRMLARNPAIIIATPGRLIDLIGQGATKLHRVSVLVLDEVDRMLDMGFIRDIERIIALLPKQRQNVGLSATITPKIEQILHKILVHPVMVSVRTQNTSEHVHQDIIRARTNEDKLALLKKLLADTRGEKVLVFGRTKYGVQKLARTLTKEGFRATDIHGNRSQPQRQRALKDFRNGKVSIMVATDVAARGLDIPNVAYVINYDEPNTYDDYIHRIGRTGRAGKSGKALTFVKA